MTARRTASLIPLPRLLPLVLLPGPDGGAARTDFVLGKLSFHLSSGVAVSTTSALTSYLTDQPDTCAALKYQPVLPVSSLKLVIAPPADGSTRATLTGKSVPAAGEALGSFAVTVQGTMTAGLAASDGSVTWSPYPDGSGGVAITALDVGFAETADRLTTAGFVVQACTPSPAGL